MPEFVELLRYDALIVTTLNAGLGIWPRFDNILHVVNSSALFKGIPFLTVIWWIGARDEPSGNVINGFLLRVLAGLAIALLAARMLQNYGPLHLRPIAEPALALKAFSANDPGYFRKLNSFPSDHAVQFFSLAFAIGARHWKLGASFALWTLLGICLPRVYFGYHYPSDILAGAVLGVAIMAIALWLPMPRGMAQAQTRLNAAMPGLLPAFVFVVSCEMAVNFNNIRDLLRIFGV
ncbi:MAG: hypothetical protein CFE31_02445 [Rhizobiales bacterium PAR1]|nr:MAG: hypothetical protein CFE31_02445 [Rhizobiales bacterium PAR1]